MTIKRFMYPTLLATALLSTELLAHVNHTSDFCQAATHDINAAYQIFRDFDDVQNVNNFDKNEENLRALVLKTLNDKQSLSCDWSHLTDFDIHQSPDKRLMSLSWATDGGGTMKTFDTVLQYHDGTHTHALLSEQGLVLDVKQMSLNKRPVYFISDWGAGYTSLHGQSIGLFTVQNHKLTPAKLIKTKQGLTHRIGFAYDPFSVPDDTEELIKINAKQQEFSIPVVIENQEFANGQVTRRTLRYRYDGKRFVYVK